MPNRNGNADGRQYSRPSRRRFLRAVGVSGTALGVAGCLGRNGGGGSGGNGDGNGSGGNGSGGNGSGNASGGNGSGGNNSSSSVGGSGDITLQFAASQEEAAVAEELVQALYDAGMPQNIAVEFLAGSNVTDQRQSQYQTWLNAGRAKPDLLRMDNGWTIPFIARNQILNLSKNLPQGVLDTINDDYIEAVVNTAKGSNGDLFAVPLWAGIPTMLYRKDFVTDAGYDPEGNNWATESMTWKRFAEITKDVKKQNDLKYGFTFQADDYSGLACCDFNEFMSGWGGAYFGGRENLFGPVGERPITVDGEQVVKSIRMIRTFIYGQDDSAALSDMPGNIAPKAVTSWTEGTSEKPFANDNAVMHRNWPYAVKKYGAKGELGKDLGVMPIPYSVTEEQSQYDNIGGPVAALGGQNLAVNPNTKHMDAALEFVKAATKKEFAFRVFEIIGQIPPRPEILESSRAEKISITGRYIDAIRTAAENLIPRPVTVVWPQEAKQIAGTVNASYRQKKPPKQAMSDLKGTLKQIEQSVDN